MSPRQLHPTVPLLVAALAVLGLVGMARPGPAPAAPGGEAEIAWSAPAAGVIAIREAASARPLAIPAAAAAAWLAALRSRHLRPAPLPAAPAGRRTLTPLRRRGPPRRAR